MGYAGLKVLRNLAYCGGPTPPFLLNGNKGSPAQGRGDGRWTRNGADRPRIPSDAGVVRYSYAYAEDFKGCG